MSLRMCYQLVCLFVFFFSHVNCSFGKCILTNKDSAEFIPVLTHSLQYPFTFNKAIFTLDLKVELFLKISESSCFQNFLQLLLIQIRQKKVKKDNFFKQTQQIKVFYTLFQRISKLFLRVGRKSENLF